MLTGTGEGLLLVLLILACPVAGMLDGTWSGTITGVYVVDCDDSDARDADSYCCNLFKYTVTCPYTCSFRAGGGLTCVRDKTQCTGGPSNYYIDKTVVSATSWTLSGNYLTISSPKQMCLKVQINGNSMTLAYDSDNIETCPSSLAASCTSSTWVWSSSLTCQSAGGCMTASSPAMSPGVVAAIVIPTVCVFLVLVGVGLFFYRRWRRRSQPGPNEYKSLTVPSAATVSTSYSSGNSGYHGPASYQTYQPTSGPALASDRSSGSASNMFAPNNSPYYK